MRFQTVISAAALSLAVLASAQAQAVTNAGQPEPALHANPVVTSAAKVVNPFKGACAATTKSKFAAYYTRGSSTCAFSGDIGPSRNLADFTHPSTGAFCFLPAPGAGLSKNDKINSSYPTVEIEWGHSSGSMLLAYVLEPSSTSGFSCPAGYIEVRTYDISGGSAALTDNVAFYLRAN